ncbi:MAG: redoxin domain-containing protein [Cryomorphaceae bacterium]|nr:redoxin domain-containing protein [Cryomorphaceae bacterium]
MKKWSTLLILLALALFYFWRYRVTPGMSANEISVITDAAHPINELFSGPLLVNFYAAWCGECLAEMDALEAASKKAPFQIICVTDDNHDRIAAIKQRFSITFPLLKLEKSIKDYGIHSIPTTFLFNGDGELVESWIGGQPWNDDAFLNKLSSELSK